MKKEYFIITFLESERGWGQNEFDSCVMSFKDVICKVKEDEREKTRFKDTPDYWIQIQDIYISNDKGKKLAKIENYFEYFGIKKC